MLSTSYTPLIPNLSTALSTDVENYTDVILLRRTDDGLMAAGAKLSGGNQPVVYPYDRTTGKCQPITAHIRLYPPAV